MDLSYHRARMVLASCGLGLLVLAGLAIRQCQDRMGFDESYLDIPYY